MTARLALLLLVAAACNRPTEAAAPAASPAAAVKAAAKYDRLKRLDFNRRAAECFLLLFWRTDANRNGAVDPDELAFLWGYGEVRNVDLMGSRGFTPAFEKLYDAIAGQDPDRGGAARAPRPREGGAHQQERAAPGRRAEGPAARLEAKVTAQTAPRARRAPSTSIRLSAR